MTEWKDEFEKQLEGLGDYWQQRFDKAKAFFEQYENLLNEIDSACDGPLATVGKSQVAVNYYTSDGKQAQQKLLNITVRVAERGMSMSPQVGFQNGKSMMRAIFSVPQGSVVAPRNSIEFLYDNGNWNWAVVGNDNKPGSEFKLEMLGELLSFALIPKHPNTP